jgi:3-oxoacyl-[acyl-carrier protein] reductase
MTPNNLLNHKVAIITGGGSGIGRGIALALAKERVNITVCGRRMASLQKTIDEIHNLNGKAIAVQADIKSPIAVERLVKETLNKYGKIDILINNAGLSIRGETHQLKVEEWDQIIETNLRGAFLVTRKVIPHMRAQKSGHIINISSEAGIEYYQKSTAYGVSKHALNAFGELLQRENQELNIRVNTICPGMVITEMTEDSTGLNESKCLFPEDIADLVTWLLTRRSNIKIGTPILIQTMQNPWE